MKISILGLGYVGAVSAGCLAKDGHTVIGVDPYQPKVDLIKADTGAIVLKLPAGQISDITLDTVIDGERVEDIVKLLLARNAGKYVIVRGTGSDEIQFFSQDNTTELMAVLVTENGRERIR